MQFLLGWCCGFGGLRHLQDLIRSLVLCALWIDCRHLSFVLLYVLGVAPRCSHAGSCCFRRLESFSGAKVRVDAQADLMRLSTHGGRVFALLPRVGGNQDVRAKCGFFEVKVWSGQMWFSIASVTKAHVGHVGERSE